MNELQLVLLAFAVVVIAVLYGLSKKRQAKSVSQPSHLEQSQAPADQSATAQPAPKDSASKQASEAYTELNALDSVPDNQASLPFGDAFEVAQTTQPEQTATSEEISQTVNLNHVNEQTPHKANHHVLEVEELFSVDEAGHTVDDLPKPNFGIPDDKAPAATQTPLKKEREHKLFVLMVLNTGGSGNEFSMDMVNHALLGVGLKFSKNQIYVTTDSQGIEIIRVANIMEPGTFPTENLPSHSTPGLAMILELPTSVRAPAAMHDLIMMARKVSQRLNGRLYNMERHLIKESDLQAMRDEAVAYESDPL